MKILLETPRNHLKEITELYVFVSSDNDGEGVIAESMKIHGIEMMVPFVCGDKARMESLRLFAKEIGKATSKTIKLIRLSVREELEVIYQSNVT